MFQRLLSSAFLLALVTSSANAQVSAYSFSQSAGSYTPITGGTTFAMTDDDFYTATIPSFTFNGAAYTSLTISTNGFIMFGNLSHTSSTYSPISSSTTGTGGVVAPFGRDLNGAATGTPEIRIEQVGNEVVVQWQDARRYNVTNEQISFQARLNTTTGVIKAVYGGTIAAGSNTSYPQVGLRGSSNTDYNNRSVLSTTGVWLNSVAGTANTSTCYFNSATTATVPSAGTTFQWTPPSCSAPGGFAAAVQNGTTVNFSWASAVTNGQIVIVPQGSAASVGTPSAISGTSISVSSLTSGTAYTAYVRNICGVGDTSSWSAGVNFTPICANTTGLAATNIQTNSADFTWTTALANAQIVVVPQGSAASVGTPSAVSGTSATMSSLMPATAYSVYIRRICAAGDTSTWSSAVSFATACPPFGTPWSDSLETIPVAATGTQTLGALPTCWSRTGDVYGANAPFTNYNRAPRSGSKFITIAYATTSGTGDYAYTPGISLIAGQEYTFSFWYQTDGLTGWDTLRATVGTSASAAAMMPIGTPVYTPTNMSYTQMLASYTPSSNGTYYFGANLWGASFNPWYVSFDDFNVAPVCPAAATTSQNNASCFGATDGTASISVAGPAYTFMWADGQTAAARTGLAAGTYNVTASNPAGCMLATSITIAEPAAINATIAATQISCNGNNDGTATASANGGTGAINFAWNTSTSSATITGLAAGVYTATATDANNCAAVVSTTITEPAAISISAAGTNLSCNNSNNGTATASANGGAGSFSFAWSNNANTNTISGLAAGVYTATATDANNCAAVVSTTITEPAAINVSAATTQISCNGSNDGEITASANGGAGSFSFAWSNSINTNTISGLSAGVYTATATDANNCSAVVTATITEPSAITNSTTSTLASCETCADGTASVTANGGTGTLSYLWSDGQTSSTASGLLAGNYTVIITDANGCTSNASVAVSFVVGISQNQTASSLRLFPNPTSSIVTLEGLSSEAQISVINALGQTIRSFQTQDNSLQIDLSDLPEATYFIRVQSSNSQQTLPVVRTR